MTHKIFLTCSLDSFLQVDGASRKTDGGRGAFGAAFEEGAGGGAARGAAGRRRRVVAAGQPVANHVEDARLEDLQGEDDGALRSVQHDEDDPQQRVVHEAGHQSQHPRASHHVEDAEVKFAVALGVARVAPLLHALGRLALLANPQHHQRVQTQVCEQHQQNRKREEDGQAESASEPAVGRLAVPRAHRPVHAACVHRHGHRNDRQRHRARECAVPAWTKRTPDFFISKFYVNKRVRSGDSSDIFTIVLTKIVTVFCFVHCVVSTCNAEL